MLNWVASKRETTVSGDGGAVPQLRVTLVLDPATAQMLNTDRLGLPETEVRVHSGTLASFIASTPALRWTDVLIAQIDPADPRELETFERVARDHATRMPVVAAVRSLTVPMTRRILRSEAVDVLPIPFTEDELHQAIETGRHHQSVGRPAAERSRGGKAVAFLGALGGIGTTVLATQAGLIWAETKSVCLIDLDLQFGNAALYLDLKPQLTLADLIDAGDRLDSELLRSVAERHASGVSVIACPSDMMPLDTLTPEFVGRMLDIATQCFDIVILDFPGAWLNWSLTALEKCDAACVVTALSVPGIHQAKRQLEIIETNGLGDRARIVANRVATALFRTVDMSEAEAVLHRKIDFPISNDFTTVNGAIEQGRPLAAIKARSRVEKDLRAMVAALAEVIEIERLPA